MHKTLATCSLFFVALCGAVAARADTCSTTPGNLVSNCGFETGDFNGWTGSTTTDSNSGVDNQDPYQGTYAAFLGAFGAPTTLSQTLATVAGQVYTIQFALHEITAVGTVEYPNSFSADFGSSVLFSETNPPLGPYKLYSATGIATGTSTTLSFLSASDTGFFDLDDISVVQATATTPEPSSLLLMGTGLLGTVGLLRRRLNA